MAGLTNLPSVGAVVDQFRRAPRGRAPSPPDGLLGLLLGLHHNNIVQWSREDAARRDDADDGAVAAAKRDIDALNAKRHELVEAIDAALAASLDQHPTAPPATESPAMVFDRLSVLVIRERVTEDAASGQGADDHVYGARLPVLQQQLALLQEGLEALFEDVRSGRKRFLPYQSLKLYGSRTAGTRRD